MKKITAFFITTLFIGISTPILADEEDYIKYRQYVMKSLSSNLKASGLILKDKVNGDLQGHAAAVASAGAMIDKIFPEGSDFGETDAKADIWENPDKFMKEAEKFKQATAAFGNNPSGKTLGAVGKSCKSCHKAFREK